MTDQTQHTPEPWSVDPKRALRIHAAHDNTIASTGATDSLRDQWEANALRIVSCVNGCAGMNPDAVKELAESCGHDRWEHIWTLLNAFASGETQKQWSRVEPLAVLGELYILLAQLHGEQRAALAKLTSQP